MLICWKQNWNLIFFTNIFLNYTFWADASKAIKHYKNQVLRIEILLYSMFPNTCSTFTVQFSLGTNLNFKIPKQLEFGTKRTQKTKHWTSEHPLSNKRSNRTTNLIIYRQTKKQLQTFRSSGSSRRPIKPKFEPPKTERTFKKLKLIRPMPSPLNTNTCTYH